jgi:hypothetical protein
MHQGWRACGQTIGLKQYFCAETNSHPIPDAACSPTLVHNPGSFACRPVSTYARKGAEFRRGIGTMANGASSFSGVLECLVLPYPLQARAWVDPVFESDLLRAARPFLIAKSAQFPRHATYTILRDTPSLKHFVLPYVRPGAFDTEDSLADTLRRDLENSPPLQEFLPGNIIAKALFDRVFKLKLVESPLKTLETFGLIPNFDILIYENSESSFHIPLRFNQLKHEDFAQAYETVRRGGVILSSKDCASGTCNKDQC